MFIIPLFFVKLILREYLLSSSYICSQTVLHGHRKSSRYDIPTFLRIPHTASNIALRLETSLDTMYVFMRYSVSTLKIHLSLMEFQSWKNGIEAILTTPMSMVVHGGISLIFLRAEIKSTLGLMAPRRRKEVLTNPLPASFSAS